MLDNQNRAFVAVNADKEISFLPRMANRHGLITGATGTGKTISLQVLAETFSDMGVPVFAADMKGDLSGLARQGGEHESVQKRVQKYDLLGKGFEYKAHPVQFWDVFGKQGHPVRATISSLGPILLEHLLMLNEIQGAILNTIFKIADEQNLLLVDLKDLQKMVQYVGDNRNLYTTQYGNMSAASIGAIQRSLGRLEAEGGHTFFGEPELHISDMIRTDHRGKGMVNILAAGRLMNSPRIYTTFLLWMLSDLFENMPEVGDLEKPKLVFFFDEAHLLFSGMPRLFLEKVEQIVRLIRSKGIGIYFVTQSPADIPEIILAQLGNRVQHALRAYTPKEQKAVRVAAGSFRPNPAFKTEEAITELGIGEALVSFLDKEGVPAPVERAFMLPPEGQIGPITTEEREHLIRSSLLFGRYEKEIDRHSAYEELSGQMELEAQKKQAEAEQKELVRQQREQERARAAADRVARAKKKSNPVTGTINDIGRTVKRQLTNQISRNISRAIFGTFFGGRK